jgi:hypothetical protein
MGSVSQFIECLFEPKESTCLSNNPKGTDIYPIWQAEKEAPAFFSVNPLFLGIDKYPTEKWHNGNIGRRADCNVTTFRNILIEMDKMPLDQQDQYISEISMPYSTAVYSGGKSIHYIISLENTLPGAKEYKTLVERVYQAVGKKFVDLANKNPSRFSRFPGHLREDTQKEQKLLAIKGRVPNSALEEWLTSRGASAKEDKEWEVVPGRYNPGKDFSRLTAFTQNFLRVGVERGKGIWNLSLFKASCDLARNGWNMEEAIEMIKEVSFTLDNEDLKTIRSAYKSEENR